MKTIITKEIDGITIITNTGTIDGLIDPVATTEVVKVEIEKTDLMKNIKAVKKQMGVYFGQASMAMKNAKKATNETDRKKFTEEYQGRNLQVKEEQEKLKPLNKDLKEMHKSMMVEKAKFFTPAQGEEILTDDEVDNISELMTEATQAGKLLDRDLNQVDNYVGKTFWKDNAGRWDRIDITAIGVAPVSGALEMSELTSEQISEISEQIETDRIDNLSAVNKAAEKESIISGLLARSAQMKTEFDILGDKDALTKAQAWYNDEIAKVELKYA